MRHTVKVSILGLLVATATACGGHEASTDASETTPASEDALSTSATRVFDCGGPDQSYLSHLELTLSKSKATIVDLSKDASPPASGSYDASYAPSSSTYKDARRYLGFDGLTQGMSDISGIEIMVSKELQTGDKGTLWIRSSGPEGGGTNSHTCKKKSAPIAVDVGTRARMMCSLSSMICSNDNPPGQTCLNELLILEKADGAELRISWIDHFGVRVEDRKEVLGDSTAFSRTKTKFKGTWGANKLSLDYRAGVTYVGTFEHDGESKKAQCNDLAMLD